MDILKPKEKEFARKYVVNNENGIKTAKEVFGIEGSGYAAVKAHRMIMKDNVATEIENVKSTLKSALESKVSPEKIALTINKLIEHEDPNANDKGLKHALNIYGVEELDKPKPVNTTYNFIFSKEVQDKVRNIEEEIKAKLIQGNV